VRTESRIRFCEHIASILGCPHGGAKLRSLQPLPDVTRKRALLAIIGVALLALRAGAASPPSFSADVVPILQKNCLGCHSSAAKMGGLVMEKFDLLMKGGAHGPPIIPGKSGESRLVLMLEGKVQPRMPFGTDPLPEADIAIIKEWIDAGGLGPAPGDAEKAIAPIAIPDIKPQVPVVSPIASLRFSPDGMLLAVGAHREVRLIDPASNKLLATLTGHTDYVRSIAFSPDGKMLAAGGGSPQRAGEIKIWNVQSHELLKTMQGGKDSIYSVAWSPDGKLIASGSYDKMVRLWDVTFGKEVRTLQDHIDAVFAVAFSPDGKRLASASQDRAVKIWDVASGRRLYTLGDATDGLVSVSYSPSGNRIAAAGYDKTIYVWSLGDSDFSLVRSLIADEGPILAMVWVPNGKMIVTSSSDGSIRFRDAATLDPLRVIENQPDWVQALSVSPDGTKLAVGRYDGSVALYDTQTQGSSLAQLGPAARGPN
jgi:dipeptidyl aminopeptidase/acylaminoacyl peptidase